MFFQMNLLILGMRQFDDNIAFGHVSTLKCALIGIQLLKNKRSFKFDDEYF
jgi:hypothetical protein